MRRRTAQPELGVGEAAFAVRGDDAIRRKGEPKAPSARFAPVAEHGADGAHAVFLHLCDAVQIETQGVHSRGEVSAGAREGEGICRA